MIKWHIGCSGFYYKHWKGTFYPEKLPQKQWFEFYCTFFNTLELNVTFYRFPQLSSLQSWYRRSPKNFRFAVKAPRAITHYKKFTGTTDMLADFYQTIREGLQEKLGCVLFQLPPRLGYSEEFLERIINSLDPTYPNVIEFRNDSWWREDVYKSLTKHNISFCGMSHPALPNEIIANTPLLYYRFHGEEQLYASLYSHKSLQSAVDTIQKNKNIRYAFIFFNNDIHTHAVQNAREMLEMVKSMH